MFLLDGIPQSLKELSIILACNGGAMREVVDGDESLPS
jgi:hypothetical protein